MAAGPHFHLQVQPGAVLLQVVRVILALLIGEKILGTAAVEQPGQQPLRVPGQVCQMVQVILRAAELLLGAKNVLFMLTERRTVHEPQLAVHLFGVGIHCAGKRRRTGVQIRPGQCQPQRTVAAHGVAHYKRVLPLPRCREVILDDGGQFLGKERKVRQAVLLIDVIAAVGGGHYHDQRQMPCLQFNGAFADPCVRAVSIAMQAVQNGVLPVRVQLCAAAPVFRQKDVAGNIHTEDIGVKTELCQCHFIHLFFHRDKRLQAQYTKFNPAFNVFLAQCSSGTKRN